LPNGTHNLDNILELLIDGKWHRIGDLSNTLELPAPRLIGILHFLSEHGFVDYRESDRAVKIQAQLKELMEA